MAYRLSAALRHLKLNVFCQHHSHVSNFLLDLSINRFGQQAVLQDITRQLTLFGVISTGSLGLMSQQYSVDLMDRYDSILMSFLIPFSVEAGFLLEGGTLLQMTFALT